MRTGVKYTRHARTLKLALDDNSAEDVDVLALMRVKFVSLSMDSLGNRMLAGDRFFSVLSACSLLKEV